MANQMNIISKRIDDVVLLLRVLMQIGCRKLSDLATQTEGRSPYLIDWLRFPTSTRQTLHELPGLWLSLYYPSEQSVQLRQWIETAQFFDLPSNRVTSMQPDRFQDQITVEETDRQHSIAVSESAMSNQLKPLVQWLTTYARRG